MSKVMQTFETPLPIDEALPRLTAALATANCAVLVAPPGAGKTTRVPLVLLDEAWAKDKKILVLEPRRLAARAAASRMAATLGEQVGETVGLRVRFGSRISKRTRIEVVTEGVFTRLVLDDPSLDGIAAVLFDEFHERSLDADLGLGVGARRPARAAPGSQAAGHVGDAGRRPRCGAAWQCAGDRKRGPRLSGRDALPRPRHRARRSNARSRTRSSARCVRRPGRCWSSCRGLGKSAGPKCCSRIACERRNVDVVALYGALDAREQDRAISPSPPGRRKIVLATSIAETSLTIEGVRIVIDSGLSRVPRYEPDVGLTRLETVRVSRAAADQRRGRAGRTEPGVSYRLWDEPQTSSLEPYTRPEILSADLSSFVLDLAHWGAADPAKLAFLDAPPLAALAEARALLKEIGAIDADGRITDEGRKLRSLPLPPRLARMVVDAAAEGSGALAATIAALLTERGLGGDDVDLRHRLDNFRRDRSPRAEDARAMVKRWAESAGAGKNSGEHSVGALLALAYPDRIAKNRGAGGAFLLANGRGGMVDPASPLAREPFLAVAELTGAAAASRIVLAAPVEVAEIEARFAGQIEDRSEVAFDTASASLRARRRQRLGALILSEQTRPVASDSESARLLAEGIATLGIGKLPWNKAQLQLRNRVMFLRRAEGDEWPDLSDATLAITSAEWLAPFLTGRTALSQIGADDLTAALDALIPWNLRKRLDAEAPTHFTAPSGSHVPIDYEAEEGPKLAIRVQELFGLSVHPTIAGGRVPLLIELLSPAHRPVQVTRDLPGFWRGSYRDVKTEMRGRYPRHPWPDDPMKAPATRRAKPRGQ